MVKKATFDAVQWLQQLVATPRVSRDETSAADFLEDVMCSLDLDTQRSGNNLWSIRPDYDEARPTLLLNAHIDTVKPHPSWTRDPFAPTIEDGRLYGLGTNDDGASLVSLLQVFRLLPQGQAYNLIFLASAEEEVGGANGVSSVLPLLPRIDVGLVGEPTSMQPAVAEKGLLVIDVTEHGVAGHAARNEGDNALYHAVDDIQRIRQLDFGEPSPLLGPVKATVTICNCGTQHNVIPAECTFTIDVRSNELHSNEELLALISSQLQGDCHARSTRLQSSSIAMTHPLVQRAVAQGRTPFGSPTLSDQSLMRFPTMKMGPGDSRRSHTADEYIEIAEIEDAIAVYLNLLDGLRL